MRKCLGILILIVVVVAVTLVGRWYMHRRALHAEMQMLVMAPSWEAYLQTIPRPADSDNAAPLYMQLRSVVEALPEDVQSSLARPDDVDDLGAAVIAAEPALDIVHSIAARSAFYIEEPSTSPEQFIGDFLPYASAARLTTKLTQVEAMAADASGRHDEAARVLADGLVIADQLQAYPLAITLLVQKAIDGLLLDTLHEVGPYAGDGLAAVDAVLADRDYLESVREVLMVERQFIMSMFDAVGAEQVSLAMLRSNREAIESLDTPYHENPVPADVKGLSVETLGMDVESPHPRMFVRYAAVMQARVNLARSAIALRLYEVEHGNYPPAFEAVDDPFTGAALVYEQIENGFVLRSAGTDLEDQPIEWRWGE